MTLSLTFRGVRGTIACPSPKHMGFGGNTSCLVIEADGTVLILDAGTGIRPLGSDLLARGVREATLVLTHTHWDHMNGFPFFEPAFREDFRLRVLAGHLTGTPGGVRAVLAGQMAQPMFPVPLEAMRADLSFLDFEAGETFDAGGGLRLRTAPLNHPNGATGYRVEYGGRALCYVTDTEHRPGRPDENILSLIDGADLVVYDSTYTDEEYPAHVGWGHSTWTEGVRLCRRANAKRFAIFHHDPSHEDDTMERIERDAARELEGTFAAREGQTLTFD